MAKTRKATQKRKSNGVKPRKRANGPPDKFGFRAGSLKSKAAAMYAAKNGATLAEVKAALKSPQFNLLTELKGRKFKIKTALVPGEGARKVTRYHIISP